MAAPAPAPAWRRVPLLTLTPGPELTGAGAGAAGASGGALCEAPGWSDTGAVCSLCTASLLLGATAADGAATREAASRARGATRTTPTMARPAIATAVCQPPPRLLIIET